MTNRYRETSSHKSLVMALPLKRVLNHSAFHYKYNLFCSKNSVSGISKPRTDICILI